MHILGQVLRHFTLELINTCFKTLTFLGPVVQLLNHVQVFVTP